MIICWRRLSIFLRNEVEQRLRVQGEHFTGMRPPSTSAQGPPPPGRSFPVTSRPNPHAVRCTRGKLLARGAGQSPALTRRPIRFSRLAWLNGRWQATTGMPRCNSCGFSSFCSRPSGVEYNARGRLRMSFFLPRPCLDGPRSSGPLLGRVPGPPTITTPELPSGAAAAWSYLDDRGKCRHTTEAAPRHQGLVILAGLGEARKNLALASFSCRPASPRRPTPPPLSLSKLRSPPPGSAPFLYPTPSLFPLYMKIPLEFLH